MRLTCLRTGLRTRYAFWSSHFLVEAQERGANVKNKGVYIYQPAKAGKASSERPSKRRKVSMKKDSIEKLDDPGFVPLLNGDESAECVQLRYDTYKQLWSEQEHKIQVGHESNTGRRINC